MKQILVILLALIPLFIVAKPKESMADSYNIQRAYEEGRKGNYDTALKYFNKEVKENPKNGFAYLGIAGVQFEKEAVSKLAQPLFCNMLKNIKQSPDFHKPGLCHVKKFL